VQRSPSFIPAHSIKVMEAWLLNAHGARTSALDMTDSHPLRTINSVSSGKSRHLLMSEWLGTRYIEILRILKTMKTSRTYLVTQCVCLLTFVVCGTVMVAMSVRRSSKQMPPTDGKAHDE
jgi:hypothetical protein